MTAAAHASVTGRFDERFLRKLESLVIAVRRLSAGQLRGNRRSRRVGAGIEFADHRDYVAGDDLRYLDWNLYGRLERLALRVYEEDEDLSIDVLVDASGSMAAGRQARSGAAGRRRARLRRPRQPRSGRGHAARRGGAAGAAPRPGQGAHPADPAPARRGPAGGQDGAGGGDAGAAVAAARPAPRAGRLDQRLLRPRRLPPRAGSAAPPQAGGRGDPGERPRGAGADDCAATSGCATSRPARRAT